MATVSGILLTTTQSDTLSHATILLPYRYLLLLDKKLKERFYSHIKFCKLLKHTKWLVSMQSYELLFFLFLSLFGINILQKTSESFSTTTTKRHLIDHDRLNDCSNILRIILNESMTKKKRLVKRNLQEYIFILFS